MKTMLAGMARCDMTYFRDGAGMLGYGQRHNTAEGVESPLFARALALSTEGDGLLVILHLEVCFITLALKKAILEKYREALPEGNLSESNLMVIANHTHSAIGGFSHYILYNLTIPGYLPDAANTYAEAGAKAVVQACSNLKPARLRLSRGKFADDVPVAFNRSLKAYNSNPEIAHPHAKHQANTAVDRNMLMLQIEYANGQPMGHINWFGVHATSISNDNVLISPDNKGYAARQVETEMEATEGSEPYVAIFAQGLAGDISPNYIWDSKKKWTRGKYEDDFKSARFNGSLQAQKAMELLEQEAETVQGKLNAAHCFVDFGNVQVDEKFTGGLKGKHTAPSINGVAFLQGTAEGPGMPKVAAIAAKAMLFFVRKWYRMRAYFAGEAERKVIRSKYRAHTRKRLALNTAEGKILGTTDIKNLIIPAFVDENIKALKNLHKRGILNQELPWAPQILPVQLFKIGPLVLAGIASEITTVAGERLKKSLLETLKPSGISEVILCPYANSYNGYITTAEEYRVQAYEGGHTAFGKWTLAAWQTAFDELAKAGLQSEQNGLTQQNQSVQNTRINGVRPPVFQPHQIWIEDAN